MKARLSLLLKDLRNPSNFMLFIGLSCLLVSVIYDIYLAVKSIL